MFLCFAVLKCKVLLPPSGRAPLFAWVYTSGPFQRIGTYVHTRKKTVGSLPPYTVLCVWCVCPECACLESCHYESCARSLLSDERLFGYRISGMMRADDSFAKPRLSCYGIWCLTSRRRTIIASFRGNANPHTSSLLLFAHSAQHLLTRLTCPPHLFASALLSGLSARRPRRWCALSPESPTVTRCTTSPR